MRYGTERERREEDAGDNQPAYKKWNLVTPSRKNHQVSTQLLSSPAMLCPWVVPLPKGVLISKPGNTLPLKVPEITLS